MTRLLARLDLAAARLGRRERKRAPAGVPDRRRRRRARDLHAIPGSPEIGNRMGRTHGRAMACFAVERPCSVVGAGRGPGAPRDGRRGPGDPGAARRGDAGLRRPPPPGAGDRPRVVLRPSPPAAPGATARLGRRRLGIARLSNVASGVAPGLAAAAAGGDDAVVVAQHGAEQDAVGAVRGDQDLSEGPEQRHREAVGGADRLRGARSYGMSRCPSPMTVRPLIPGALAGGLRRSVPFHFART